MNPIRTCAATLSIIALLGAASGALQAQGVLRCGEAPYGLIRRTGEQHFYTFEGQSGDIASLSIVGISGGLVPVADLYKPPAPGADTLWMTLTHSGRHYFLTLPASGTYTLRIHDDDFVSGGEYAVNLSWILPIARQCPRATLHCGENVYATISRSTEEDEYQVLGKQGERWTITLVGTSGNLFPVLELLDPAFIDPPILSMDHNDRISEIVLPKDGIYTVRVHDNDYYSGGTYVLSLGKLDPICDCNQNGHRDDADISSGSSRDDNDNLVPDECEVAARAWIEQAGPKCVRIMVDSHIDFRGGQFGLQYDSKVISNLDVTKGAALPASASISFDANVALTGCPAEPSVDRGLTVGWTNSQQANVLTQNGTREVLKVCYRAVNGVPAGRCSPFKFVGCLGGPTTPVRNVLVNAAGASRDVFTIDGQACVPLVPVQFRRGDANQDGRFDIADAVSILICQFLNIGCTSCKDAHDANDDGAVGVTDAVYMIDWRFNRAPAPPLPFPACGADPTADTLPECLGETCR